MRRRPDPRRAQDQAPGEPARTRSPSGVTAGLLAAAAFAAPAIWAGAQSPVRWVLPFDGVYALLADARVRPPDGPLFAAALSVCATACGTAVWALWNALGRAITWTTRRPRRGRLPNAAWVAGCVVTAALVGAAVALWARPAEELAAARALARGWDAAVGASGLVTSHPGAVAYETACPVTALEDAAPGPAALFDALKGAPDASRPSIALLAGRGAMEVAQAWERAGVLTTDLRAEYNLAVRGTLRWPGARRPPRIKGWRIVDSLDCTVRAEETPHGYVAWARGRGAAPSPVVAVLPDAAVGDTAGDGGRRITGGERLVLQARTAAPLVVLMRAVTPRPALLTASLNGGHAEPVPLAGDPARFQTVVVVQAPADAVRTTNEIRIVAAAGGYASFAFWAFQPVPTVPRGTSSAAR